MQSTQDAYRFSVIAHATILIGLIHFQLFKGVWFSDSGVCKGTWVHRTDRNQTYFFNHSELKYKLIRFGRNIKTCSHTLSCTCYLL